MLTGTTSEVASYEFTTLTCIPGVIHYNDAKIQLLDLPGIIEGAAQGKGGRPARRKTSGKLITDLSGTPHCKDTRTSCKSYVVLRLMLGHSHGEQR